MLPMLIVQKTDGYEVHGYVYSDDLTADQRFGLGVDSDSCVEVAVDGVIDPTGESHLYAYAHQCCIRIKVDQRHLEYAIEKYISFHPQDSTPDPKDINE